MSLNKKTLGASAAVVALSAFVPNPFMIGDANAQATATAVMNVSANVTNPLGVAEGTALNFGVFAVFAGGGTITFNNLTTTIAGGVMITTGTLGSVTFTAPQDQIFTISIPEFNGGEVSLTQGGGGAASKSMTVTKLKFVSTAATKLKFLGGGTTTYTFRSNNEETTAKIETGTTGKATIGGILTFSQDQLTGAYAGTYTVSITF